VAKAAEHPQKVLEAVQAWPVIWYSAVIPIELHEVKTRVLKQAVRRKGIQEGYRAEQ
jgi:hypothetical protein